MSSVESVAVLMTRCLSVGLADVDVTRLKALGWCSFAAFAFSSVFQLGAPANVGHVLHVSDIMISFRAIPSDMSSPWHSS